jgi:2-haloacid dehalogenase
VWSVEEVAIYKPDPRVYALAGTKLGLSPRQVAFVSSNSWDACGAAACGLRVAWVNRTGDPAERLPCQPENVMASLAGLPEWLARVT